MKKLLACSTLLALAGLSTTAMAADGDKNGFARIELGSSNVSADLDGVGEESDDSTAFAFRGGYFFNRSYAIEAFYGQFYDKAQGGASADLTAIGIGAVARKHFGATGDRGFFVEGRAGISRGEIEVTAGALGTASESSTDPYFGIGGGYAFNPNVAATLGYTRLKGEGGGLEITADVVSAGREMRF